MAFLFHVGDGVRVDDLVSESSIRQVRSLWDVENLIDGGLCQSAGFGWPELTQDAEQARFTAAVRAGDK